MKSEFQTLYIIERKREKNRIEIKNQYNNKNKCIKQVYKYTISNEYT